MCTPGGLWRNTTSDSDPNDRAGEGLILGLLAWLIAIPLSVPVGQLFAFVMGQAVFQGLRILYQFSWNGALQWLIIIVVLSILGSLLPAIRATRVSVRESLAYE